VHPGERYHQRMRPGGPGTFPPPAPGALAGSKQKAVALGGRRAAPRSGTSPPLRRAGLASGCAGRMPTLPWAAGPGSVVRRRPTCSRSARRGHWAWLAEGGGHPGGEGGRVGRRKPRPARSGAPLLVRPRCWWWRPERAHRSIRWGLPPTPGSGP
jgi:hypothetical protein